MHLWLFTSSWRREKTKDATVSRLAWIEQNLCKVRHSVCSSSTRSSHSVLKHYQVLSFHSRIQWLPIYQFNCQMCPLPSDLCKHDAFTHSGCLLVTNDIWSPKECLNGWSYWQCCNKIYYIRNLGQIVVVLKDAHTFISKLWTLLYVCKILIWRSFYMMYIRARKNGANDAAIAQPFSFPPRGSLRIRTIMSFTH